MPSEVELESRVKQEVAGVARSHGRLARELVTLRRAIPVVVTAAFTIGLLLGVYAPLVADRTAAAPPAPLGGCGSTWCQDWMPTGQTCPGGCVWRRTCKDDCSSWTETACWPSSSGCPLSAPGADPSEHVLREWMNREGLELRSGIFYELGSGKPVIPAADEAESPRR